MGRIAATKFFNNITCGICGGRAVRCSPRPEASGLRAAAAIPCADRNRQMSNVKRQMMNEK